MGSKKNALWSPRVAKTPPKWRPTWASKNLVFEAQVGTHLGRVLAPKIEFLRPNMAPCWPHVSRQHEFMLDGQHGPMLEANMDLCWRPTWTHVLCARGAILCAQGAILCAREQFCVPGEQFSVPGEQFCVPGSSSVCPDNKKSIFSVPGPLKINIFCPRITTNHIFSSGITENQYFLSPDH